MVGSQYNHEGAAVDPLCIPTTLSQQYLETDSGYQGHIQLHGAGYSLSGPLAHSSSRYAPCALCQVNGHTNKIMIPSHYECPSGWRREYYGYLMAGRHSHKAATQFTCIDKSLEQVPGTGKMVLDVIFTQLRHSMSVGLISFNVVHQSSLVWFALNNAYHFPSLLYCNLYHHHCVAMLN